MISFSTDRTAQIRATKAKSPNFQSRINNQTNPMSQDMFVANSKVNLAKSASIKRLQPVKPLKTQSFGNMHFSGPIMHPVEAMKIQRLFELQQKVALSMQNAAEHSDLDKILGQNPGMDKKEFGESMLELAKGYNQLGQKSPLGRVMSYVFALKAIDVDESNPHVHEFIKKDLGVPLAKAFEEKAEAILNGQQITMNEARLSILSEDEARKFMEYHNSIAALQARSIQINEDAQMAQMFGEEPQVDQKALAKDFFNVAKNALAFADDDPLARFVAYDNAVKSISLDSKTSEVHHFLGTKLGVSAQEALHHVTEAVKQKPFEIAYLKDKAFLHVLLGQKEEAIKTADRAISISPNTPELYFSRALVNHQNGNVDAAVIDYKKVAELDPQNLPSRSNLGLIEFKRGNQIQAVHWYDEVEKAFNSLEPEKKNQPKANLFATASQNRGIIYMDLGVMDKAKESFTKAIETDPTMTTSLYKRAAISFHQGNYSESIQDLDAVIEKNDPVENPDEHVACATMKALNLINLNRDNEAEELVQKTQQNHPDYDVKAILTQTFRFLLGLGQ